MCPDSKLVQNGSLGCAGLCWALSRGSEPRSFSSMTPNNHAVPHWLGKETLGNKNDRKGEHLVELGVGKVYS